MTVQPPVYPSLQVHLWEPLVLVQFALTSLKYIAATIDIYSEVRLNCKKRLFRFRVVKLLAKVDMAAFIDIWEHKMFKGGILKETKTCLDSEPSRY